MVKPIHIKPADKRKIQNVIDCARLEVMLWTFLSPSQQQSLRHKIQQFQQHLDDLEPITGTDHG